MFIFISSLFLKFTLVLYGMYELLAQLDEYFKFGAHLDFKGTFGRDLCLKEFGSFFRNETISTVPKRSQNSRVDILVVIWSLPAFLFSSSFSLHSAVSGLGSCMTLCSNHATP